MRKILTAILGILLLLLLFGCSANWHARQAQKHQKKAKMKDPDISFVDTVWHETITTIPKIQTDTIFHVDLDTVILEKERLKIRYIRTTDSVYLEGECDSIYITEKVPVTVQETVYVERLPEWWRKGKWYIIGFLAILVLFLLNKLIK